MKSQLTAAATALALAACASGCASGPFPSQGGPTDPFLQADRGEDWGRDDRAAHRDAFLAALAAPAAESVAWTGERFTGAVTAEQARLVFSPDAPDGLPAPPGLRIPGVMELDLGPYVLASNSNVRLGPSTDDVVAATWAAGSRVEVMGRLVRAPWMLVAREGEVRGYIHADLLQLPAGARPRIAGARLATPIYCRALTESVESADGASDMWTSRACRRDGVWTLTDEEN